MSLDQTIIQRIRTVIGQDSTVALHEPAFIDEEWQHVKECLDTNWVSSAGPFVREFEERLAELTQVKHAIVTVNGTCALHIANLLSGIKQGDEVLCPSLTFVATANAITYCGGVPHFIDSDPFTLGIHTEKLEKYLKNECGFSKERGCYNKKTDRSIKALVFTHMLGHMGDMKEITRIANEYDLFLIEDAAQALGSEYQGVKAGHFGKVSALSFNGNKIITTGGGGAILTNDDSLALKARHISTTSRIAHRWDTIHDEVGYNYRMPNLNAALGVSQLKRFELLLKQKRALAKAYSDIFSDLPSVQFMHEPSDVKSNYWLCSIKIKDNDFEIDRFHDLAHAAGLLCRPLYRPLHLLPMYESNPKMAIEYGSQISKEIVCLPSSSKLGVPYA